MVAPIKALGSGPGFGVSAAPSTAPGSATGFSAGTGAAVPAGLQPGVAQPQLKSLNQAGPTAAAQNWTNNESAWNSPSGGETNTWGLVDQFTDPNNRVKTTQNSQDWLGQFQGAMPNIAAEPGFGAYFDNAKRRAQESINQTMAARGAYGSSAANDQTSRAFADLEGQRALKEADYNLQRLGEQRAWQGLGGSLAGQADNNSLQRSQQEQSWVDMLNKMGIDASQLGLSRLNAGQDAATSATAAERARGQDYFNNQLAQGDRIADLIKSITVPAIDNDAELATNASSAGVAQGNQAANNERTNAQDTVNLVNTAASIYGAGRGRGG